MLTFETHEPFCALQPAAVARMAMHMHRFWKVFVKKEMGPLPELVYTQVIQSAHCICAAS